MPKQFVHLIGQGWTFQQVLACIAETASPRGIIITNAELRFVVAERLRELGRELCKTHGATI
jgi:mannose-1-phosphate guanylyltransferase